MSNTTDLAPGDRIEIRYRIASAAPFDGEELRDKWIAAEIKSVEGGIWPLARLADGQWTEVRRYMQWRYASSHLHTPRPHPRSA